MSDPRFEVAQSLVKAAPRITKAMAGMPSCQVPNININTMSRGGMKKAASAPQIPQLRDAKYVVSSQVIAPRM